MLYRTYTNILTEVLVAASIMRLAPLFYAYFRSAPIFIYPLVFNIASENFYVACKVAVMSANGRGVIIFWQVAF